MDTTNKAKTKHTPARIECIDTNVQYTAYIVPVLLGDTETLAPRIAFSDESACFNLDCNKYLEPDLVPLGALSKLHQNYRAHDVTLRVFIPIVQFINCYS